MGWLKPEVDLIDPEFRGDWAHLRAQPGDPPAGPVSVTARGERVWGLRLDGDSVTEEEPNPNPNPNPIPHPNPGWTETR